MVAAPAAPHRIDEAKRTALKCGVSVTPGIDNGTALTLLKKHEDLEGLKDSCKPATIARFGCSAETSRAS